MRAEDIIGKKVTFKNMFQKKKFKSFNRYYREKSKTDDDHGVQKIVSRLDIVQISLNEYENTVRDLFEEKIGRFTVKLRKTNKELVENSYYWKFGGFVI